MLNNRVLILYIILLPINLFADMSFASLYDSYRDFKIMTGESESTSLIYHSYSNDSSSPLEWGEREYSYPLWETSLGTLKYMSPEMFFSYNTSDPYGRNDGAIWQGVGFNMQSNIGIEWDSSYFSIRFNPQFWFTENRDFHTMPTSISRGYGDWWDGTKFDRLQRMGENAVGRFSWGNSDIRFKWKDILTFGISTENIIIGDGKINNILQGKNAEGFPHIDFGTYRPQPIWKLGMVEGKIFWGVLSESEYYDNDSGNDYGWISGLSLAYAPSFVPGLVLGASHQYYKAIAYWRWLDLVTAIPVFNNGNRPSSGDDHDAMWSANFRWRFPSVGFSVYGEFAMNDHSHPAVSPEHTSAFTIGGTQVLTFPFFRKGRFLLTLEHTNLGQTRTSQVRAAGPWYRHGWSGWEQGYVNKGQLVGASIGPGSNSQYVDIAYYYGKGVVGFDFMRICYDNDYYYNVIVKQPGRKEREEIATGQNVELEYGLRGLYFLGPWNLYGKFNLIYAYNHNWNYRDGKFRVHGEFGFSFQY